MRAALAAAAAGDAVAALLAGLLQYLLLQLLLSSCAGLQQVPRYGIPYLTYTHLLLLLLLQLPLLSCHAFVRCSCSCPSLRLMSASKAGSCVGASLRSLKNHPGIFIGDESQTSSV